MEIITRINQSKQKFHNIGYVLALASAVLASLMHVVPKELLDNGINDVSPITLAFVIYIVNGLFFTSVSKKSTPISKITKKNGCFFH
ncbi:hypothetical protein [Candidatus Nitrosarchaeum limnium]|uniref:EamA domain-containing protein n=1 Tax=Candidatus Nitrosarchaeum limnium BG20 TaxID=859192 RepID=S2EP83_9ARCH|nr:hypothetical protein [Candidatus Nitrosarchaeum limnium]EPA04319.1 hypothetical protein BG20_I1940 [Candidatus Nitrosarchaeum limnium BG20]